MKKHYSDEEKKYNKIKIEKIAEIYINLKRNKKYINILDSNKIVLYFISNILNLFKILFDLIK